MDFCSPYFGKSLLDLSLSDIESFFQTERSESDQIEFKSIHPSGNVADKLTGLKKSICAFLNSNGGLLIWGAPQGTKKESGREKVFIGSLTWYPEVIEKDFLISKLSDGIIPLPIGIRAKIFTKDGQSLAVIEIEASEYAPHQTGDIFYMRIDGQSKPAPHHYIEALFKRIRYPNIENYISVLRAAVAGNVYKVDFRLFFFNWSPLQNEEDLSFRIICGEGKFQGWDSPVLMNNFTLGGHEYFKNNAKAVLYYGEPCQETFTILFDPHNVEANGKKARFTVSFAGRFSPRKISEYVLDFTRLYDKDPDNMITEKIENKSFKERQDEKGLNKESILKNLKKF